MNADGEGGVGLVEGVYGVEGIGSGGGRSDGDAGAADGAYLRSEDHQRCAGNLPA